MEKLSTYQSMLREQIARGADEGLPHVPEHLRSGLRRYLVDRVLPGRFLQALVRNDLADAVLRADEYSLASLKALVLFLHNHAPSTSHGSPEALQLWVKRKDEQ